MKNQILSILIAFLSLSCYSQVHFKKGYFIDNSNKITTCLIKNLGWGDNPTKFEYQLSGESNSKMVNIETIQEFGIYNIVKYIRKTVNIDRSSESLNNLSYERKPIFKLEELFLKVLIESKASLYEYKEANLRRYFYNIENSTIEQLIFKSYKRANSEFRQNNNQFKQQLLKNLKCSTLKISDFESLNYKKKALVTLFVDYNECKSQKTINFEAKQKKDLFNLNLRPRLINSSLAISSPFEFRVVDLGNNTNFSFGVEAEFILSFHKNKWSIIIEPTYQSYKGKETKNTDTLFGGELTTIIDYNSIEIPLGIRHYFFLNDKSKVFVNACYATDFSFNSSSNYIRKDGFKLEPLGINSNRTSNLAFGFGYKYNDRYSLELRTQTSRVISKLPTAATNYRSTSIIIGYSLF